jgi:hypothetical protein
VDHVRRSRIPVGPRPGDLRGFLVVVGRRRREGGADRSDDQLRQEIFQTYELATKAVIQKNEQGSGFDVQVSVVPDGAFYRTALELEQVAASGYRGEQLRQLAEAVRRKHAKDTQEVHFRVAIAIPEDKVYLLQGDLRRHIAVTPKMKFAVQDVKERPVFETFKVYREGQMGSTSLARIKTLFEFTIAVPRSVLRRQVEITWRNVVGQTLRGNHDNGINLRARQISCRDWSDLIVPPITVKIEPYTWESSPSAGIGALATAVGMPREEADAAGPGESDPKSRAPSTSGPAAKKAPKRGKK